MATSAELWKTKQGIEMSDQEWKDAFEQDRSKEEHTFSWSRWYDNNSVSYPTLRAMLFQHDAIFTTTFTRAEGKCIKCTARMSISDVGILIPNDHGGKHTVTLITDYRDHRC